MPSRRFIALLAAGLLLVAGFTAAAVAGGGNPFDASEEQSTTDHMTTGQTGLDQTATSEETSKDSSTDESSDDESENESANEETTSERTATSSTAAEHKVTICHHTGSTKHPFHPITVDEHAVTAHTDHGDTVGPCPTTTSTSAGVHAKQKHESGKWHGSNRPHRPEHDRGNGSTHGHGNQGGGTRDGKHAGEKQG
jgi:cytoskeletal protein RodZ